MVGSTATIRSSPRSTGDQCEAIILYHHTGTESTSELIAFIDTGVTGLPLTPDGSDVQIVVDAAGWFAL